ncbi:MAG: hypothetical protein PHP45_03650 [Elusimicrobiales bacterium]|nr:hypothetical protein [Elusimicrobiales bacterium]
MLNLKTGRRAIRAMICAASAAVLPPGAFCGQKLTLKTYYPAPVIVSEYAASSTLNFFDKDGIRKLGLYASPGGAGFVEAQTGDLNVAAASGYIWLAPSGRGVSVGNGLLDWCGYKPLAADGETFCSVDKPYAFAVTDPGVNITYDINDIAGGGYLLCCAAGVNKPEFAGGTPPVTPSQDTSSNTPCTPHPPDVRVQECPDGQKGALAQIRYYTCPAQTPGEWMTMGGTCLAPPTPNPCVPPAPMVQVLECPYPQNRQLNGYIYQSKVWSCDGSLPVTNGWVTTKNTCGQECAHDGQLASGHINSCCSGIRRANFTLDGNWVYCSGEQAAATGQ